MHCHFRTRLPYLPLSGGTLHEATLPYNASAMQAVAQHPYYRLMRLDRPVGTWLLLWPTLAALWIAAEGWPGIPLVAVFFVGTFVMRAAGCVVNDLADRDLDGRVERTQDRPLATEEVSVAAAVVLFLVLLAIAASLALALNLTTFFAAAAGAVLVVLYPFCKRFTHLPQFVLGIVFSWGIVLAFTATRESVPLIAGALLAANALWIVAYDTIYARVDRDDDLAVGIKSTAVLLGRYDRLFIGILQIATLALLLAIAASLELGVVIYLALTAVALSFAHQQVALASDKKDRWFRAFKENAWTTFAFFIGTVLAV